MTSRLENFHKAKIHIRLLARRAVDNEYFREVSLLLEGSETPVEFRRHQNYYLTFSRRGPPREFCRSAAPSAKFSPRTASLFAASPRAFLRLESDAFIRDALRLEETHFLYGRRNTLVDPWGRPLAEIVEILPPTAPRSGARPAPVHSSPSQSLPS